MTGTHDMFAALKPPRKVPEKLMHVCEAAGCCEEDGTGAMVRMLCARCGYETKWLYLETVTAAKRGIACPHCNENARPRNEPGSLADHAERTEAP